MSRKAVLITGCSSGMGRHAALALHKRGYRLFAATRTEEDQAPLREAGLETVRLDYTDSASIHAAAQTLLAATGGEIYGLFNNGAYGLPGAVEDLSRDAIRTQFETNVFGWIELTNLLLPSMVAAGEGRIIMNSSVLGLVAMKFRGAYNASKFAIEGFGDTLRLELRGTGVFVSLIEPGPIASSFRKNSYRAYQKWPPRKETRHGEMYRTLEKRLTTQGAVAPFTLGPEAVTKRLIHALESKRPQARYYVTFPTYLFGTLRRLLPHRWLDAILGSKRVGGA